MITRENPVLQGLARALWMQAFANEVEEEERQWNASPPHPGPGGDWADVIPDAPERAYELAFYVIGYLEQLNKNNIHSLVANAFNADGIAVPTEELLTDFGFCIGMSALGTGVSWEDDHEESGIQYPDLGSGALDLMEEVVQYLESIGIADTKTA